MKENSILIYFNLRKYGFIEKNKDSKEVINILSKMHSIIDKEMNKINGKNYKIQTDTSTYILDNYYGFDLYEKIKEIKNNVDQYMKMNNLPSVLHITIIAGNYYSGYIKTDTINQYNIFGEIMNTLQKFIFIVDNSKNTNLNEGIAVSQRAYQLTNMNKYIEIISELNEEIHII